MRKRRQLIIISDDDDGDDEEAGSFTATLEKPSLPQDKSSGLACKEIYVRSEDQPDKCGLEDSESETITRLLPRMHPKKTMNFDITADMEVGKWQPLNMQLWVDKYRPKALSDLAVHNKKVAEVREWLEAKLRCVDKLCTGSCVLVLAGPTGVGKTTVVRVLVDLLDAELCEWDTPVPTLWKEYLHHVNSGAPYTSKLKEFEVFLESVKNYPLLPMMSTQWQETDQSLVQKSLLHGKSKVLLLDDLPTVQGRESVNRLCHCLHNFALSVQFPTVVVVTDFVHNGGTGQELSHVFADIQQALESGGASKVMFNPITANAIKKVLTKISLAEKCPVASQSLSFIAESCEGDIRHAIYCLQFLCLGRNSVQYAWDPGGVRCGRKKSKRTKVSVSGSRSDKCHSTESVVSLSHSNEHGVSMICRDGVLSLFHALGKLLHNKRHKEDAKDSGASMNLVLKDHLQRHPLNMEAPETIFSQAHTETSTFSSFLHENFLDFVDDEGIEDVAVCLSYLSDVDCLLGVKYKVPNYSAYHGLLSFDEIDPGNIAEATAGSLAARGVLFANNHQGRHRWQSIRAPALRQVERLLREKKLDLWTKCWVATMNSLSIVTRATQVTDYEPYYKEIFSSSYNNHSQSQVPYAWKEISGVDTETDDGVSDTVVALSQEQELSLDLSAIDINRKIDVRIAETSTDCDDEIEEW